MVFLGNIAVTTVSTTTLLNLANKQISVQVRGGGLHLAIDVVGYFRAPAGGYVNSITAGTGLTGGTITSSGTIAVDTTTIQSRVTGICAAGSSIRTINANGTVVCETDDVGGAGTVTSVGTGTGLTGGPITGIGTINLATTQLLPTVACTNGQTPVWNGSAWVCSDPSTFGGNINLADSTSASVGNIMKGATRFIHNYGSNNTFVGKIAGNFAMTGAGNSAIGNGALSGNQGGVENTASGLNALTSNTIGNQNTANGSQALYSNTIGSYNTATGNYALLSNVTGFENTASGHSALQLNATGFHNTAIGSNALHSNASASYNTASGAYALSSNTTGSENTAIGSQALYLNTTGLLNTASGRKALGTNTSGIYDTASGSYALSANTDGSYNTASGTAALYSNTSGNYNTASGTQALYSNQNGSYNSVSGNDGMYSNTSGNYNTASGSYALYSNTTGFENTASGSNALFSNTTGRRNAASGNSALYLNTTGSDNTAIGYSALFDVTTETGNTAVGSGAKVSGNNATAIGFQALALGDNATAIGFQAHAVASNYVWLGNASVTLIGGQVAWSNPSDLRDKKDIADSSLGLDFVKALRPVEFKLLNGNDRVDFGFIAQEVEALIGTGYNMLGSGGTAGAQAVAALHRLHRADGQGDPAAAGDDREPAGADRRASTRRGDPHDGDAIRREGGGGPLEDPSPHRKRAALFLELAQAGQVQHGDAAVLDAQQARLLEPLQRLVRALPRQPGELTDFFLRNRQVRADARIEDAD